MQHSYNREETMVPYVMALVAALVASVAVAAVRVAAWAAVEMEIVARTPEQQWCLAAATIPPTDMSFAYEEPPSVL